METKMSTSNSSFLPTCSRLLYFLLLSTFFAGTMGGSSSSVPNRTPHFTSHSDLNHMYSQDVTNVERVMRPASGSGGKVGVPHAGVRVTTGSGEQWLVHKGPDFGKSSDTVVVPAKDMSSKWQVRDSRPVSGAKVHDYVKSGGKDYKLATDNCLHSSDRMYKTGN